MRFESPSGRRTPDGSTRQLVLAAACMAGVSGCAGLDPLSDPPPDPEVRPLDVVVDSSRRPDTPCLLNTGTLRGGEHQVTVIGESGYARVRILDQRGRVVFRTDNAGQRIETDEDGDVTIIGGEGEGEGEGRAAAVRLAAGRFTVQCRPRNGQAGEAKLQVLPARPGHGSSENGP